MASTRDKARSNLKRLSRKPATIDEIKTMFTDLRAESNDRAIALIAGATVDDVLTRALLVSLGKLNSDERSKLFDPEMPLGSFGARIKMAYALRICERPDVANLECIKDVRNAFAHASASLAFVTPEVVAMCQFLRPEGLKKGATIKTKSVKPGFLP